MTFSSSKAGPPADGGPPARIALLNMAHQFTGIEEIYDALTDALESEGGRVTRADRVADVDAARTDALLVIGSPVSYPSLRSDAALWKDKGPDAPPVFFWHFEPLPDLETPPHVLLAQTLRARWHRLRRGRHAFSRGGHLLALREAARAGTFDRLFVYTRASEAFLRRQGLASEYLPMGYHPVWGRPVTPQAGRDIDVLFVGQMGDNRRGQVVREVRDALAAQNVRLTLSGEVAPAHGLWGEERNALLNRTKIYLNVFQHPLDASGMRLSIGMGNGCLVVSEPIRDAAPFADGAHFVQAPVPELAATILRYLGDAAARQRIADAAFAVLQGEYNLRASARQLLQAVRARRA